MNTKIKWVYASDSDGTVIAHAKDKFARPFFEGGLKYNIIPLLLSSVSNIMYQVAPRIILKQKL